MVDDSRGPLTTDNGPNYTMHSDPLPFYLDDAIRSGVGLFLFVVDVGWFPSPDADEFVRVMIIHEKIAEADLVGMGHIWGYTPVDWCCQYPPFGFRGRNLRGLLMPPTRRRFNVHVGWGLSL